MMTIEALTVPARPGVMVTSAIACAVCTCADAGCAAAAASARGGGVKRQAATTQRIASAIAISVLIQRARGSLPLEDRRLRPAPSAASG